MGGPRRSGDFGDGRRRWNAEYSLCHVRCALRRGSHGGGGQLLRQDATEPFEKRLGFAFVPRQRRQGVSDQGEPRLLHRRRSVRPHEDLESSPTPRTRRRGFAGGGSVFRIATTVLARIL